MVVAREKWAATPLKCVLISVEQHKANEDARQAAVGAYREAHPDMVSGGPWPDELSELSRSFHKPGEMWFCPWLHDPTHPGAEERRMGAIAKILQNPAYDGYLSIHYWNDHAKDRPPISVIAPDWREWCVDAKSSNGDGWQVRGEAPDLVCSPSIWMSMSSVPPGYHGYLGNNGAPPGWFTTPL